MAFQRMIERIRHSSAWSPGLLASMCGGMVLMYSVVGENGRWAPARRVTSTMPCSSWCARSGPSFWMTAVTESIHSWVSVGSGSSWNRAARGLSYVVVMRLAAPWPRLLDLGADPAGSNAPDAAQRWGATGGNAVLRPAGDQPRRVARIWAS